MPSRIILKSRRARPFYARHPWLFAGAIERVEGTPVNGDEVAVHAHDGQFIAWGLFNSNSQIRVRLYSWVPEQRLEPDFWKSRIDDAIRLRHGILGLNDPKAAYRLVFSESDGLSGLVVDRYGEWLIVQFTSLALSHRQQIIIEHLIELLKPRGVYLRTERGVGEAEGLTLRDGPLWGQVPDGPVEIVENDLAYETELRTGQKTGFYLDQRDNRRAARGFTAGRRALDVCCYTGGFALNLARGGATEIVGVDVSVAAIDLARLNAGSNAIGNVRFEAADAFAFLDRLAAAGERFGLVVLDPPRFARSRRSLDQALGGYQRLNEMAVKVLEPDGILVTCSCSGQVSREDFSGILGLVAEHTGRSIQILEQRGQSPDHPVAASCPETNYLKCFICRVA
jgi:23S rRNA (cytosine1962-C5)-methyltransferase